MNDLTYCFHWVRQQRDGKIYNLHGVLRIIHKVKLVLPDELNSWFNVLKCSLLYNEVHNTAGKC